MNKPSEETAGSFSKPAANNKAAAVSLRKVAANRQNALKSTGPRTARGKAFSRRNAWKHGLFARELDDFVMNREDPSEYRELLDGLREQFRSVGSAEELEVERIAQCWWRLKRACRYENGVNRVAQGGVRTEVLEQAWYHGERECEKTTIKWLQDAQEVIEATGEIPEELKKRISTRVPNFDVIWTVLGAKAKKELNVSSHASALAPLIFNMAVRVLKQIPEWRFDSAWETAVAQRLIPNRKALDKLLRFETAVERMLGRALDRLERLQRRRLGEAGSCLP